MPSRTDYSSRADRPGTHPLTAYLLQLMSIKRSNLCVSADVHSTAALLRLAEEVGDSICILKTHADIIDDFGEDTIQGLQEISRRKKFLLFEDRKFGDIGSTVQSQYTRGPLQIAHWAHLTNAHIFPGPAIITALHAAATSTLHTLTQTVYTEITAGTPIASSDTEDEATQAPSTPSSKSTPSPSSPRRKSVVTATTTISLTFETSNPTTAPIPSTNTRDLALSTLGPPPLSRGLLLLAEMSSAGSLMTGAYTQACVALARQHQDFVVGFIAQRGLNEGAEDNFLVMTPGVSLPPEGREAGTRGDGLGQLYRTPREVVRAGADVVIVGRGVVGARERERVVERYREVAWEAYERRVGGGT